MASSLLTGCFVRSAVYPAPKIAVSDEPPGGMQKIELDLTGDRSSVCWWFHNSSIADTAPAMLYLHGNGENLETMRLSGLYEQLAATKVHFIALDYPGYGRSKGAPSEGSVSEACDSALVWIARKYPQSRIIICGWSLGAAAAIGAAARNTGQVSGLIAMSAWTSLYDVASRFYPGFLVKWLLRDRYASIESVKKVKCPVLFIHGKVDNLIPFSQAEALHRAAPMRQRLIALEGTGHNDLLDSPVAWGEISRFVRSLSPAKPAGI